MVHLSIQKHQNKERFPTFITQLIKDTNPISEKPADYRLVKDLSLINQKLESAQKILQSATKNQEILSSGVEWFLDNFHAVQQSIALIQDDLPEDYFNRLPTVKGDKKQLRIYTVAKATIENNGMDLNTHHISELLQAYQEEVPLRMSELWALPLILRILFLQILTQAIIELEGLGEKLEKGQSTTLIHIDSQTPDETIASCIRSLIAFSKTDWEKFFEANAVVEKILRRDPAQKYQKMDFDTRDDYRKVIERLASHSPLDEVAIAQKAIEVTNENAESNHIGYFLISDGLQELQEVIDYQKPWQEKTRDFFFKHATIFYLGTTFLITLAVMSGVLSLGQIFSLKRWQILITVLISIIPASSVGVNLINSLLTWLLTPNVRPKMSFEEGVPKAYRTLVVIPALLTTEKEVDFLIGQLEQHYLTNQDREIGFGLVSDFADAPQEHMPEDQKILHYTKEKIKQLNNAYQKEGRRPFFLFHRERQWNEAEGAWMGWERKRGKLTQLNHLILGKSSSEFDTIIGDLGFVKKVRFVITLDADTTLPRDSAIHLIAALAHPLNRPVFKEGTDQIIRGYTILQPRTEVRPTSVSKSLFTRIFAGDLGLDLYTHAVSDVYQDLFSEGIYVGKGIYDVAAFERSLKGKVPENSLLSHDLFEGSQGRAALVSDVILYEDFPPNYISHMARLHRWVRGDWQLLPWLLADFFNVRSEKGKSQFSAIDTWKILDNLRRSLLAPSSLLLFLVGWFFLDQKALLWTLLTLAISAFPLLKDVVLSLSSRFILGSWQNNAARISKAFFRWTFWLIFLPFRSIVQVDAIITTLVRLTISHKRLLQWTTSAHTLRLFGKERKFAVIWEKMLSAPIFSLVLGGLLFFLRRPAFWISLPLLLVWLFSPQIAYWISQIQTFKSKVPLKADERKAYRNLARKTWLFFEKFVGPDDHWLPPDHYQEDPKGTIAHRTSPTNIGLMLLSTTAAYDLGYIGLLNYLLRLKYTFQTLDDLEKYRGHLLNWYNTQTKQTLSPRYVSTVDSGNFAASLIGLRQTLCIVADDPVCSPKLFEGLIDSINVLCEFLEKITHPSLQEAVKNLKNDCQDICQTIRESDFSDVKYLTLPQAFKEKLTQPSEVLMQSLMENMESVSPEIIAGLRHWSDAIYQHLDNINNQIEFLMGWVIDWQEMPDSLKKITSPIFQAGEMEERHFLSEPLHKIPEFCEGKAKKLSQFIEQNQANPEESGFSQSEWQDITTWAHRVIEGLKNAEEKSKELLSQIRFLIRHIDFYLNHMAFDFLFDQDQKVFFLGYKVGAGRLDQNHYDLLASEARTASLIAIAKNQVPRSHWLHLSRPVTIVAGIPTMISWNGSMFEYLMPDLFTQTYPNTLMHQTSHGVVDAQINYGKEHGVPWGVSESSYYRFDSADNYQYQGFGIPSLGRKRGLQDDLVVAPYASLLAAGIRSKDVLQNIRALKDIGMMGLFGFYESVDFTASRLPVGKEKAIIKSYMAHHQGMILVSLSNVLTHGQLPKRIHKNPHIKSVELLLQEQIPHKPLQKKVKTPETIAQSQQQAASPMTPWTASNANHLINYHILSNGELRMVMSETGSGFLQWKEKALTRWHPDSTLDQWGIWFYIQDTENQTFWSIGRQPIQEHPDEYQAIFSGHQTEIRHMQNEIRTNLESTIAPNRNALIQRITLSNQSSKPRRLRIMSYGEVVLAPPSTDQRHPAFNKLFIESRFQPEREMLLFNRRQRSSTEPPITLGHALRCDAEGDLMYEADRLKFIGRCRESAAPIVLLKNKALSNTTGTTLDPIFSLSKTLTLKPNETVTLEYLTIVAEKPETVHEIYDLLDNGDQITNAFNEAKKVSEKLFHTLEIKSDTLKIYQQLLSNLLVPGSPHGAAEDLLQQNTLGQAGLWSFGISGDFPILLATIDQQEMIPIIQNLIKAHTYWRKMGLKIDFVILNIKDAGYTNELNDRIHAAINTADSGSWVNRRGGIFVITASQINQESVILLKTAARCLIDTNLGNLKENLADENLDQAILPAFMPTEEENHFDRPQETYSTASALFANGIGGFVDKGQSYQITLNQFPESEGKKPAATPAPWINVIANPQFGFLISETGATYSWYVNSGENRLSPWFNDPVSDPNGEALYLRDEMTGKVWSPTPHPAGQGANYQIKHSQGFTQFLTENAGFHHEMTVFVDQDAPVKMIKLTLHNKTEAPRRITGTYYIEWVLGINHTDSQAFIIQDFDHDTQTILARNTYSAEFSENVAFLTSDQPLHGLTTDRREFLGYPGNRKKPAALEKIGLTGDVTNGKDPCAALQIHLDFEADQKKTIYFILGQEESREKALQLAKRFKQPETLQNSFTTVTREWQERLKCLQIETPSESFNILLNHWLLYQALSCRIWGRSAFYQSSGAYGFRDQLQDVTSILTAAPEIARDHILRAAAHQFDAGDVLHWWHPPSGRGVRTRISDDLLWLVYVTWEYIQKTGDKEILNVEIPFMVGEPLEEDEEERYGHYQTSDKKASLFEHCRRALKRGTTSGPHGLPLIGAGDWNDGMNRVGIEGQGESVWLGWFLFENMKRFAALCDIMEKPKIAEETRQHAETLKKTVNSTSWDDKWFLRAFYDDGSPLGSHLNTECQIDSLPQSWSILTEGGKISYQEKAIKAVQKHLIKKDDQLILLFTPPFDRTKKDPGYIKGYPRGIRENGGQYTHAAIWAVWAMTKLGMGEKSFEAFQILNPINHSRTLGDAATYAVEPYVVAADVYSAEPYTGRGGWTWYTGSSGWLYRLGIEAICGFNLEGEMLRIDPCIPRDWDGFKITYQYRNSQYQIQIANPDHVKRGVREIRIDGHQLDQNRIPLKDDEEVHQVEVVLGNLDE